MNAFFRLSLVVLLLNTVSIKAQNLVPNGSFEEYVDCPTALDMLGTHCVGWFSSRGTCDYFNGCKSTWGVSVPANVAGYQESLSGGAYAGFVSTDVPELSYREQMSTELTQPLTIGLTYYFSMHVSNGQVLEQSTNKAANGQGAYFTTIKHSSIWDDDPIDNPSPILNNPPIINLDVVNDSTNWVQIKGSFIADSAYTYVVIGAFLDEKNIQAVNVTGEGPFENNGEAYYYVDEVRLSVDSMYAWQSLPTHIPHQLLSEFSIYPNPVTDILTITMERKIKSIQIIDLNGSVVSDHSDNYQKQIVIDVNQLPIGLYFIKITDEMEGSYLKKMIKF